MFNMHDYLLHACKTLIKLRLWFVQGTIDISQGKEIYVIFLWTTEVGYHGWSRRCARCYNGNGMAVPQWDCGSHWMVGLQQGVISLVPECHRTALDYLQGTPLYSLLTYLPLIISARPTCGLIITRSSRMVPNSSHTTRTSNCLLVCGWHLDNK